MGSASRLQQGLSKMFDQPSEVGVASGRHLLTVSGAVDEPELLRLARSAKQLLREF